jgi:two-component system response regulator BaeR
MQKQHILIVEDETKIAELIRKYLKLEGYQSSHAKNGSEAISLYHKITPDLIILDIMLPDIDGLDVCEQLREFSDVPIIMLTARVEEVDRLIGFELGADDYVCKPFIPRELVARIRAILNRTLRVSTQKVLQSGNLALNISQHQVTVDSVKVKLTQNEFSLLKVLMSTPNKVFSRQELLTATQGQYTDIYERTIDTHIKNLRKKLNQVAPQSNFIESIYGIGYRLIDATKGS